METCHLQESFQANKTLRHIQDNPQLEEREVMKDHQSIQKALMFMPIKIKCSTGNRNTKHQVTKKMPLQTFHLDRKWEGTMQWTTQFITIIMESISHILHKLALEKLVTCKIISQILEDLKTQAMIFMSQLDIDSDIENKWKVLESAELLVSMLQDMRV